jgi:hypothetical protein
MNAEFAALVSATAAAFTAFVFAGAAWHKSAALVTLELAVPVAMLVPGGPGVGAGIAILLLCLYAAAMAINIARGRVRIECGCGGAPTPLSLSLVVRNALLAAVASLTYVESGARLSFGEAAAAVSLALLLWVCFLLSEQILANGIHARAGR